MALLLSWRVTSLLRSFSAIASVLLLVGAGGALAANVQGTAGGDRLTGTHGPDLIRAGAGDDEIRAGRGGDQISGGPGSDRIWSGPGADVAFTGRGGLPIRGIRDWVDAGTGHNLIRGGPIPTPCSGGAAKTASTDTEEGTTYSAAQIAIFSSEDSGATT